MISKGERSIFLHTGFQLLKRFASRINCFLHFFQEDTLYPSLEVTLFVCLLSCSQAFPTCELQATESWVGPGNGAMLSVG